MMGMFIMSLGEFADIYDSFSSTSVPLIPKVSSKRSLWSKSVVWKLPSLKWAYLDSFHEQCMWLYSSSWSLCYTWCWLLYCWSICWLLWWGTHTLWSARPKQNGLDRYFACKFGHMPQVKTLMNTHEWFKWWLHFLPVGQHHSSHWTNCDHRWKT